MWAGSRPLAASPAMTDPSTLTATAEATPTVNPYQRAILRGLNRTGKHIFAGIETPAERAIRRRLRAIETAPPPFTRAGRRARLQAARRGERAMRRDARRGVVIELPEEVAA